MQGNTVVVSIWQCKGQQWLGISLRQHSKGFAAIALMGGMVSSAQVSQPAGEVVKPNSWKCITDEGMPVHGRPYEKGNLYVHFNVKFPTTLTQHQVAAIQQVLPSASRDSSENGVMDVDSENVRPLLLSLTLSWCPLSANSSMPTLNRNTLHRPLASPCRHYIKLGGQTASSSSSLL